jgi:hypothetical protein
MFPPAALRVACRAARTLAKVAFVLAAGTAAAADETTLRVATTLPNFVEQFDPNKSFLSTHDIVLSPHLRQADVVRPRRPAADAGRPQRRLFRRRHVG